MSAQALASEVRPNLAIHHVIKSADQLHFKDKQVYTQLQTEHKATGAQSSSANKGKASNTAESSSQQQTSGQNRLKETIDAAKKAVDDGLREEGNSSASHSPCKLASLQDDVAQLKTENQQLRKEVEEIRQILQKLVVGGTSTNVSQATSQASAAKAVPQSPGKPEGDADEDFDLFGSDGSDDDGETEQQKKVKEERLAAYAAKKAKKPGPIAKSSVILDVKPWDDETDLVELERLVRSIEMDGLLWGAGKLLPIGYGIKKLQIICVVEDDKVSVDDLIERIQDGFEEFVQSVDVAAFNKI